MKLARHKIWIDDEGYLGTQRANNRFEACVQIYILASVGWV
jgi:hypothetical protein